MFAVGFAEEVSGVFFAVGVVSAGVDKHSVHIILHYNPFSTDNYDKYINKLVSINVHQKKRKLLPHNDLRESTGGRSDTMLGAG